MKTIKVFIASSEELKLERLEFVDMIQQLNDILESRNIQIKPVKWEYLDASMSAERKQTEYNNALRQCELCLVLYWTKFGSYTEEELNTAYEGLKAGENPRKLYIYFKETPADITPELQEFKSNFATQYGHFYCKFENVDTMRLNFLLQFEQYQSAQSGKEEIVKVKDSQIEFYGQKVAELKNVPFAGKNPDFLRLQEDLQKLQQEIITFETIQTATPNDAIAALLLQKRMDREKLTKQLEELEKSLMDTAKQIVGLSYTTSSVRLQKAIELFEQGDNKGANAVLDFDEIKSEMEQNALRIDQARELEHKALEALRSNIEECKLKVKTLQTEKPEGWLQQCIEVYDGAMSAAEGRLADVELAKLRFDYALLLQENNQFRRSIELYEGNVALLRRLMETSSEAYMPYALTVGNLAPLHSDLRQYDKAEEEYNEALSIYHRLAETSPEAYLPYVALTVGNLANLHSILNQYDKAEEEYNEAFAIYRRLAEAAPEAYLPDVALTVGNLANLHSILNQYDKAEEEYNEALSICRRLAETAPEAYLPDVALNVCNLASLHGYLHQYNKAEKEYIESLSIYRRLAEAAPEAYLPNVALTVGNLANLHGDLHQYDKSEEEYSEALAIYRRLAETSPEAYLPDVALTVGNLANLHGDLHQYDKSEEEYNEALAIYRRLAETSPEAYLPNVALNVGNLAFLQYLQKKYESAKSNYEESIGIYRGLCKDQPSKYSSPLAGGLNMYAYVMMKLSNLPAAYEAIDEAIALEPNNPDWLDSKGEFLLSEGRDQEALATWRKVLELDPEFNKHDNSDLYSGLKAKGLVD